MEPRKDNQEQKRRFQIVELEERIAPDVSVNLLGTDVAQVHVDAQVTGTLPILGNIDLHVTL